MSLEGSTIYATHMPCRQCAKMLANAKIKRYVTFGKYDDNPTSAFVNLSAFSDLFADSGIEFEIKGRPPLRISYLD